MILSSSTRMTQKELQSELADMTQAFKRLMARSGGAERILREIGVVESDASKTSGGARTPDSYRKDPKA